jgi:FkbM family methyltransferase
VPRNDLIIDVGMHVGEDTRFYLDKGFNVVAVEANPDMVRGAEVRFADEIAAGRLRIFEVAIAECRGEIELAIAGESGLASVVADEVRRAEEHGFEFERVPVTAVPFDDILREVGVPYYLKVDIEGMDLACVRALRHFDERPIYVSIESSVTSAETAWGFDNVFAELAELWTLGYRAFNYVNQMRVQQLPSPALEGRARVQLLPSINSSGAFGREVPGRWLTIEQALLRGWGLRVQQEFGGHRGRWASLPPGLLYRGIRSRVLKRPTGFFDLHARWGA